MLVFYLAALDSDDDKNKFEYIYRKYYRFMLHTAAGIIKNPTWPRMRCMRRLCSCCVESTRCALITSGP